MRDLGQIELLTDGFANNPQLLKIHGSESSTALVLAQGKAGGIHGP